MFTSDRPRFTMSTDTQAEAERIDLPLAEHVKQLWLDGELCDCLIHCKGCGEQVHAHRLVLASSSAYFSAMFTGAGSMMREGESQIVSLEACELAGALERIISSLYTGTLYINKHSVVDPIALLKTAHMMDLEEPMNACERSLRRFLRPPVYDVHTAFYLLQLGVTLGRSRVRRDAINSISSFGLHALEGVLSTLPDRSNEGVQSFLTSDIAEGVLQLDFDAMHALIATLPEQFIPTGACAPALAALLTVWADRSSHSDEKSLQAMLQASSVLDSAHAVDLLKQKCQLAQRSATCRSLLQDETSGTNAAHSPGGDSIRGATLVAAGGHESSWRPLGNVEMLTSGTLHHAWREGPSMPTALSFMSAAPAASESRCYVLGGTSFKEQLCLLSKDNESYLRWDKVQACMHQSRVLCGLCCIGDENQLLAFGGRHKANAELATVELLHTCSDDELEWKQCTEQLCSARSCCGSAVVQAVPYAVGGQKHNHVLVDVEARLGEGRGWTTLSNTLTIARKYCSAVEQNGCLFVAGGMDNSRRRVSTVDFYDPRAGVFERAAPMTKARSSFGLTSVGGTLIACGGNCDAAVNQSAEVLDPRMNKWRLISPLQIARAGLILAAI